VLHQNNGSSEEIEQFVQAIVVNIPANQDHLETYRTAQIKDTIYSKLIEYCTSGWPARSKLPRELKDFCGELTMSDTLLLYLVPASMHQITLEKIHQGHQGHQGIERCRQCISSSVWWPGVSKDMENFVRSWLTCQVTTHPNRQSLISTPLPSQPWEYVAADLFEQKNVTY